MKRDSTLRVQLGSSTGRRMLVDTSLIRLGQAVRTRLVKLLSPQAQLELVTNIENWLTRQAVRVVASLDIPDLIDSGVTDLDDLAARVGTDRDALARLSRHLVSRGVFTQPTPSTLGLSDVGKLLRSNEPSGRHEYFQLSGVLPRFEAALAGMMYSVRTGEPAYAHVHGEGLWQQMAKDPLLTASFDAEMNRHAKSIGPALAELYDWRGSWRVSRMSGAGVASCYEPSWTVIVPPRERSSSSPMRSRGRELRRRTPVLPIVVKWSRPISSTKSLPWLTRTC